MSEMTSAVETQQQQQQYVGASSNVEHHCKDCGLNFESEKSLEVHLRYHQENLLNQWANKTQQEESNNNHSKTGNHNSHVNNRDNVPADSSEPSSMSPSQDPTSSQQTQQQQQQQQSQQQSQQQPAIHTIVCSTYDQHFRTSMFNESGYWQNDQNYILPHHFSPSQEDSQNNGGRDGGYNRYHPYHQHQQLYPSDRTTSNSTSPQSPPFQCDKCGAVYEDANQLGEHMRTNHLDSPTAYPSAPQYQQLGNSPQQQGQQLHSSPPLSNQPQQSGYDYNGGQAIKSEMKQEQPEEQAEILDLDSHKVQTHRYEEEIMRLQQQHQHQQGIPMQIHHQQVMQQQQSQRIEPLSVSPMLGWQPIQPHDYAGHPSMGSINNVPSIADQDQYLRGQHMPVEHGHQSSPIITSTQPMTGHQMSAGFVQQTPKAPPMAANQSWKSNEPRRPKTYNCTACNKWFTSSGHLKRHYNTTLHKNAVKNGKEPDPASLPINAHHHPTRENSAGHSTSGRGGGVPARSPSELSSSRSPPNLMAGPSGEATGGLLHTPTTLCNNNSSSSNSSSESLAVLVQQQQQQLVPLGIINSPVSSPLAGHHQQQMGTAPHQLGLQQQQQQLHLPTGSSGQPVHHSTTSPTMPPPAVSHMNCPSPMGSSSHPVHHMTSPPDSGHPAMTSSTVMGGTTMPHQPYPNALPPHVTVTTNIPAVLESTQAATTMQLVTIGNEQNERPRHRLLPGFKTILPSFTEFGFVVDQNQTQAVNVGGLNVEEIAPQESFESSASTYDPYSPTRYKSLNNIDMMTLQTNASGMMQDQDIEITLCYEFERHVDIENNNNHLSQLGQAKEDLDPNIGLQPKKERKTKSTNKQCQITTTGANFISQDGVHKCIDCNKYFNKPCYLTQHNKSFHSGDKPFKCSQCGKRFSNEEKHKKHTEMHTMARKHKCDVCPKIFAHKTDLKRHNCIHTGTRPFKCDACGKGFIRQDHMKKHKDTHNKKSRINNQRQAAQRLNNSRLNTQRVNTQRPSNVQRLNVPRLNVNYNIKL